MMTAVEPGTLRSYTPVITGWQPCPGYPLIEINALADDRTGVIEVIGDRPAGDRHLALMQEGERAAFMYSLTEAAWGTPPAEEFRRAHPMFGTVMRHTDESCAVREYLDECVRKNAHDALIFRQVITTGQFPHPARRAGDEPIRAGSLHGNRIYPPTGTRDLAEYAVKDLVMLAGVMKDDLALTQSLISHLHHTMTRLTLHVFATLNEGPDCADRIALSSFIMECAVVKAEDLEHQALLLRAMFHV